MNRSKVTLYTPRLILRSPIESDAGALYDFDRRNQSVFSPLKDKEESEVAYRAKILKWNQEFLEGVSVRFILLLKDDKDARIIGFCNFTQIFRGFFQACYLGYHIDQQYEGKGLMSEALKKAIQYMFEEQNLHRIMANYMPANKRSAKLLLNLGFTIEGLAKDYLLINGSWEDHILTSLANPKWTK